MKLAFGQQKTKLRRFEELWILALKTFGDDRVEATTLKLIKS